VCAVNDKVPAYFQLAENIAVRTNEGDARGVGGMTITSTRSSSHRGACSVAEVI
jgi:hypothetical protein